MKLIRRIGIKKILLAGSAKLVVSMIIFAGAKGQLWHTGSSADITVSVADTVIGKKSLVPMKMPQNWQT